MQEKGNQQRAEWDKGQSMRKLTVKFQSQQWVFRRPDEHIRVGRHAGQQAKESGPTGVAAATRRLCGCSA